MEKPTAQIIGQDGNIFNILGICTQALKRAGQREQAKELSKKVFAAGSYDEALSICMDYVEVE